MIVFLFIKGDSLIQHIIAQKVEQKAKKQKHKNNFTFVFFLLFYFIVTLKQYVCFM